MDVQPSAWGEPHGRIARRAPAALTAALLFGVVSVAIPASFDDGIAALPRQRRPAGEAALREAKVACLDNIAQRGLTFAAQLSWLHPTWTPPNEASGPSRSPVVVARVRTRTFFGVPAEEFTVFDDGSSACDPVKINPRPDEPCARGGT